MTFWHGNGRLCCDHNQYGKRCPIWPQHSLPLPCQNVIKFEHHHDSQHTFEHLKTHNQQEHQTVTWVLAGPYPFDECQSQTSQQCNGYEDRPSWQAEVRHTHEQPETNNQQVQCGLSNTYEHTYATSDELHTAVEHDAILIELGYSVRVTVSLVVEFEVSHVPS